MIAAVLFGYLWAAYVILRSLLYAVLVVVLLGSAPGQALVRALARSARIAGRWAVAVPRGIWRPVIWVGKRARSGAQYCRAAASERTIIGLTGLTITSTGLGMVSPALGVTVFGLAAFTFAVGPLVYPSLAQLRRGRASR